MSAAERVYAWLLRAYPAAFRETFGREMLQVFRDQRRATDARRGTRFWSAIVWDVMRSAPALQFESVRGQWREVIQHKGATMKAMAFSAVVIGALDILNTLVEAFAGGFAGRSSVTMLALVLAALSPALLLGSGVALLMRSRGAVTKARGAAVLCLVVFAAIAAFRPIFSIAATLLGIGFPIALLIFLYWHGRGGRSASMA